MSRATSLRVALLSAGIVYGLTAEIVATNHGQLTTYAGGSGWFTALELAAGWSLVAVGAAIWQLRPEMRAGPLTVAAGFAWFAPDFAGWEGGPVFLRSVGMLIGGFWLPLLLHVVLTFPRRRVTSFAARALVATIYFETAVVGVGRALFRDPFADLNCWNNCTGNTFLIHSDPGLAHAFGWFDLRFAVVFAAAFAALSVWRTLTMRSPTRRLLAPILGAAVAVTVAYASHALALLQTPLEDPHATPFAELFIGQSLAAAGVASTLGWALVRTRRPRRELSRLAVALAGTPEPGALEAALVRGTGDPSLRIVYRLRHADRYVDYLGRAVTTPASSRGRAVTAIVRNGQAVALLEHDSAVLDADFETQIGAAARLAVENERLQAEARAQLIEIRKSRVRIVQTGDAARQRLERDLHDGAQQRLVALSFALRLAISKLGPEPDPHVAQPLEDADRALAEALRAVREVAHGLFPAALTSSGLAYAVEELAELAPLRIELNAVPDRRLAAPIEAAAYGVIREAVENAALHGKASTVSISASCSADVVIVEAADDGVGGADPELGVGLLDVADRVGALGGKLTILSPSGGGTRIHAEIPCA